MKAKTLVSQQDSIRMPGLSSAGVSSRKFARIQLFGTLRATTYSGDDLLPRSRKARFIFAYLCLARDKAASRTRLASLLWDRVPEGQARASLRQALSELASPRSSVEKLVTVTRETLSLDFEKCWIDALAVLALLERAPDEAEYGLLKSVGGTLLDDLYGISNSCDEWLLTERSFFEDRIREIHERRLARLTSEGAAPQHRAQAARELIEFDSTHERGWQILLKALVETGDRAQAIKEYQRCREIFGRVLQIEPSIEIRSLHDAIRVGERRVALVPPQPDVVSILPIAEKSRLRVAVLPFSALGFAGDALLPASLALDTAAALARFRWFDVIAPIALPALASNRSSWGHELKDLNVDYAVHGTLKTIGNKIQVKIILLNVHGHAAPVWSDSYDLPLDALGEADERVTTKLVARIDPIILFIEGTRSGVRNSSGATRLVLRAIPLLYGMEKGSYHEAGLMLIRAVAEAPDHSMAAAWLAFWYVFKVGQGWSSDPAAEYLEAERLSQKAIQLDPENAEALGMYAHMCSYVHQDFDAAVHYFERSLLLNPSLAFIWALSAPTSCYLGDPDDALSRLKRYRDLAPFDPYFKLFETMYTMVYVFAQDYEKAVVVGRRTVRANPNFTNGYKPLLAALGYLGQTDEAAKLLRELLLREPDFSIRNFEGRYPFRRKEDRERYISGLRKAGVPEV
jgi:DNA-binding SARP family transcriptional activator/TolB-like protein